MVNTSPVPMDKASRQIHVLAVDDHPLVRAGIGALLAGVPDMVLLDEASSGQEAIEKYRLLRPDVVLMDIQMPDMDGVEALEAIRAEFPEARIIMLTTYGGDLLARRSLRAGARAYVLKQDVRSNLAALVRAVHAGEKVVAPEVARSLVDHADQEELSGRERLVLAAIARGNSNRAVGEHLAIAEGTVKSHVKNILSKLGANDRTHAVMLGVKRGLIELP